MTLERSQRVWRPKILAAMVVVAIGVVYSATAEWSGPQNVDVIAAAAPGYALATTGSFWLADPPASNPWFIEIGGKYISDRPVGLMAVAAGAYLLWDGPFSTTPVTAEAVLLALGVVVVVARISMHATDNGRLAVMSGAAMGLGTSTWSISAAQLWPHGPAQLALGMAVLGLARGLPFAAGLAAAAAVTIRPITAVAVAAMGLWTFGRKRWTDLMQFGGASILGLLAVVWWNWAAFGRPSITGGYSTVFTDRVLTPDAIASAGRVIELLVSPQNGMLVWSPFLLVLAPFLPAALRRAPRWVTGAFVGGVVYLVIHGISNRASGGLPFGYRYQLEALVLMAPAFVLSYVELARRRPQWKLVVLAALILAVFLQLILATTLTCVASATDGEAICRLLG